MTVLALLKNSFHNAVAESVYSDIQYRRSNYYYYMGKTISWDNELAPDVPTDSFKYEQDIRSEIITAKLIKATDLAYVVPRYNWSLDEVGNGRIYDQYDDQYDTSVRGIDLMSSGSTYQVTPKVYIGSTGYIEWRANTYFYVDSLIKVISGTNVLYYTVKIPGTTSSVVPTHTTGDATNGECTLSAVTIFDGNGTGAKAEAVVDGYKVVAINLIKAGAGYTAVPSVLIVGDCDTPATAEAVITRGSATGAQKIEDARFYVLTNDYKVYKCLDNNNGGVSEIKPVDISANAVQYEDGYVWKFMYTIPASLRNKFFTNLYMPVINAQQNQFYNSGEIRLIRIESPGLNYTRAKITVSGDGYLEDDPIYITNTPIISNGTNYVDPVISFDDPFDDVRNWVGGLTNVMQGQYYVYNDNIYEVLVAGTFGVSGPLHTSGSLENGDSVLKYVGTRITGTVTVDEAGAIDEVILNGKIRFIDIINEGSGYSRAPVITIGDESNGASATAIMQNESVTYIEIISSGNNFTSIPDVVVGNEWSTGKEVSVNDQVFYGFNLYTVVNNDGVLGNTPPIHTTLGQIVSDGSVELEYVGQAAKAVAYLKYGAGYKSIPKVYIDGYTEWYPSVEVEVNDKIYYGNNRYIVVTGGTTGSTGPSHETGTEFNGDEVELEWIGKQAKINVFTVKSNALLYPVIQNKQIIGVTILNSGVGYTYALIDVIGNEESFGAKLFADLSFGDINSLQSNVELLTVDGQINCIPVVSGGYNYTNNSPGQNFSSSVNVEIIGDGTGATATASVVNGRVNKIHVINPGSGYRWANVKITRTSQDGFGATARAIIGPYGGHGSNAINELFAKTLVFFTNISTDKNQGFNVDNDYRQIGIIKAPRRYNSNNLLTTTVASGCWAVEGNIVASVFPPDSLLLLTIGSNKYRFRVVSLKVSNTVIFATPLSGVVPNVGDILTDILNNEFLVTYVTNALEDSVQLLPESSNVPNIGTTLTDGNGNEYEVTVINQPATSALIQSLDNIALSPGNILANENNDSFVVSRATAPTIDKYSGSLMFVDNRQAFTLTTEQIVTLRTLIEF